MYTCIHIYIYIYSVYSMCNNVRGWGRSFQKCFQWNLGYAKHKLKCHCDFYTLSQGFVWIKIILLISWQNYG